MLSPDAPASEMAVMFEIFREQPGRWPWRAARWQWRLKADEDQTLASGEGYASQEEATRAVEDIKGAYSAGMRSIA